MAFVKKRNNIRLLLVIILLGIVLFSMFGEKVALNNGAGWDGVKYRGMARNFSEQILNGSYEPYRIQRVLPFAVENICLDIAGIEKSDANLMNGIQILNFIAIIFSIFFFFRISNHLKLSISVEALSFIFLFYNFPILKLIGYYPFLSDTYAFLLGLMIFDFFINHNKIGLTSTAIVGAFTWPVATIVSLFLLCLSKGNVNLVSESKLSKLSLVSLNISKIAIILAPSLFILGVLFMYKFDYAVVLTHFLDAHPFNFAMFLVSTVALSVYAFFVVRPLRFDIFRETKSYVKLYYKQILVFVLLYFIISQTVKLVANDKPPLLGVEGMLKANFLYATTDPFVFIVNHFLYFGFAIIFIIIFWKKLLKLFSEMGMGFILTMALTVFFSFRAESRVSMLFYPLIVMTLVLCIKDYDIKPKVVALFGVLSLILSRFWFIINTPDIGVAFLHEENRNYINFPAQRYFMNMAHWQDHWAYCLFGILMVLSYILIKKYQENILIKKD